MPPSSPTADASHRPVAGALPPGSGPRWLAHLEEGLVALLMAAMTLLAFTQVLARYFFSYSFTWALEVIGVMFAWLIFIGMGYGVRVGTHIGVDVLLRVLPSRVARACVVFSALLCIVYALVLAWGATQYVLKMHAVGIEMQDVPIAQWIPRLVLPAGFLLLALRFAQALWQVATGRRDSLLIDEGAQHMELAREEGGA